MREPQALFTETCRIAVEKGGFRMAWVGLLDAVDDSVRPVAYAGVTNGYLDKPPIVSGDGPGARPATIVLREGRRAVCNDIKHDPGAAAWRDEALARGYRSAAAFPLTAKGKTIGTFTLYASEPEFFDTEELVLLDEMASDLAFAMELNQSEERQLLLSTAIEQAPASVVITDTEGRIEYVNPAFTEITGFTPEEVLGKNPRLLKSGQHDRPFYQNLWNTIVAGKSWHGEIVNRRKDGSLYMEDGSITPVRSGDGQIVRFVSIRQDVTARHQMEQDLRESEERYRLVVEHIHDALITDDLAGKITFANDQFLALFGFEREQLPHLKLEDYIAPEWREQLRERHDRRIRGETVPTHFECEGLRQDGGRLWVEVDVTPLSDGDGQVIGTQSAIRDISDRKRAEKLISDALSYAQTILDTSPVGIITYKASGEAVDANRASAQLVGASIEHVKAQNFRHLKSWQESGLLALAEAALASGKPTEGELRMTTTFGKQLWVRGYFVPFTYNDESHLLALFEDVAERKQAEESLRLFRMLVDQANDIIQVVDLETMRLLDVNDRACSSLGYTREELLSMHVYDIDPTVNQSRRATVDDQLRKSGSAVIQGLQRRKDGSTFPAEISLQCIQLDRGYVICAVRDVTERKQSERALVQAEEKYRRIFEDAVVGIFQVTPEGRLLDANPAMARMHGYDSPQQLMAEISDVGRQVFGNPGEFQEMLLALEENDAVRNVEVQIRTRDGGKKWLLANARAIRGADGRVVRHEGTVQDITERRVLEEQLRMAQRLDAVGRLAGGVAHDFNNMLGVIIGYSELLEDAQGLTEVQNKQVKEIKKTADRAAATTRQLLAFSRKQILQPRVLNLNELAAAVGKLLRRLIGENVELVINAASDLGRVKADPSQMEQVIMNLAINARDAMPQGGKLVIETANADLDGDYAAGHPPVQPGPYVMLAVSDTGCGMDAETKAHIFEPFFTTKELGKGTGLGLSIVYGVVKQSNGYILAYSEPGQGTTFKIYLPRVEESPDTMASRAPKLLLVGGTETILLVEDESSLRSIARAFLEGKGYTILEAQSGQEAVEIARQHRGQIHLLLTDVIMPGMSGRELAEALAGSRAGIKLLYMSGYTDELVKQHGILNPGLQLLEKPFTRESLLSRVRAVLDGKS